MSWIFIIILLFWVGTLSSRLSALERKLRGATPVKQPDMPETAFGISQTPPSPSRLGGQDQTPVMAASPSATDSNILAKIGVLALLLGLGFFFKYSIDQGWVNEWTRVIIGLVVSGLMIFLGILWREKFGVRAEVLAGGGVAIGFFALYAGHGFYGLYNYGTGIVAYIAAAGLANWLAFKYNFRSLSSIGVVGAFFAPVFFGLRAEYQTFLIFYLSLLSVVLLGLFFAKQWLEMPALGLVSSIFVFGGWVEKFSTQETSLQSWIFSAALFFVYSAGVFINYRIQASKKLANSDLDTASAIFIFLTSIQFFGFTQSVLSEFHPEIKPWAGILGAIVLLIGYVSVDRLEPKNLNYTATFFSAIFFCAAIVWRISNPELEVLAILILSIIGFAIGIVQKREELRVVSLLLIFVSIGKSLFISYPATDVEFLLNPKLGLTLLASLVLGGFSWIYSKQEVSSQEKSLSDSLSVMAIAVIWFAVSWDIWKSFSGYYLQNTRNLLMSFWWAVMAVGALILGRSILSHGIKQVSLALFGLTIAKVFLYDVWALDLVYRIVAFIVLGIILLSVSFGYNQNKEKIIKLFE